MFYFHTDLVGSIRAVTDSTGQVVARYEYEPFGLRVKAEGPLAGEDVHKFTGKPEDGETGLYYLGARYYDAEVGRFLSRDPAAFGPNWYVYCEANPLKYIDPDGKSPYSAGYYLGKYQAEIKEIAAKYDLPEELLKSVIWNENKKRTIIHEYGDAVKAWLGKSTSLGVCQVQISTAAFLDRNPRPELLIGITPDQFKALKDAAFESLSYQEKRELVRKLLDPVTNIEYAARYLDFLRVATGTDGAQLLADYKRGPDHWHEEPSSYGRAYGEYSDLDAWRKYSWANWFYPLLR